jgi:hypothetical protein
VLDRREADARIDRLPEAGIAQLVEHNLAKVGVASSNLVSRSTIQNNFGTPARSGVFAFSETLAGWQSGYAAACKAVDAGSIPTPASIPSPCFTLIFSSRIKELTHFLFIDSLTSLFPSAPQNFHK